MKIAVWLLFHAIALIESTDDGVKYADQCEVCKIVTQELEDRLLETGKSHDVIETGYNIEGKKKNKKYKAS